MTAARSSARADADRARQHQTDHTKLTNACQELAALWPQLGYALAADTTTSGDVIGRGGNPDRTPRLVNRDVAEAHVEIVRWTGMAVAECTRILQEPYSAFITIVDILKLVPHWHDRLHRLNLPTAGYLLADALHAHNTARRALGLRTHDRPTGANCPEHPDHPAPLYWLGRDGTLDTTIISSNVQPQWTLDPPTTVIVGKTWRIPTGAITWTRSDTVRCPACGTTWTGIAELNILARRLAGRTTT